MAAAEAVCERPGCGRPGLPCWDNVRDRSLPRSGRTRPPDRYVCHEHLFGEPRRKYRNEPVQIGDQWFDSKAEARRWGELLLLQQAGVIRDLVRQPRYELEPAVIVGGRRLNAVVYLSDFQYEEEGRLIAEDVKGGTATVTAVFRLKARLFRGRYPEIELRIVE